jgi:nitrite reductase (NO-forming)
MRAKALIRALVLPALVLVATAGSAQKRPAADADESSRTTTKLAAATMSEERHTGSFAAGKSLSLDTALKPLDPSRIKVVQLDTSHKVVDLAPGVKYSAWTFGDQVPGPTVRARVGDKIRFSMTNRSDELLPGAIAFGAPMMHSMDFHSAMVSPQDKYRSIAPGQTISFEFTPQYPGVFMYHCGTPMILEHIASGMYGVMVVEPQNGYPTRADREYVVVQSEFYTRPDPEGREIEGQPLHVLDTERVRTKTSSYVVFNGRHNGMVDSPLFAKPRERVRLFVLNVGPSNTSSFHVVGTIFDRVWLDGNPQNELRGMQTVLLGSSSGAIVEFRIPEPGAYVMVDHHFANASQGAIGVIDASGATKEKDIEHHNIAATPTPTDAEAAKGKLAYETKCLACHSVGEGDKLGPDLLGVTKRRTDDWLVKWLKTPERLLETDEAAKAMLRKYKVPMPNQGLPDDEVRHLIKYFHWFDQHGRAVRAGAH